MNVGEELSDEQKYANYVRLLNAITHIETHQNLDKDKSWMEEQKGHIMTIYEIAFPDGIENTNPEIDDPNFRRLAKDTSKVMNNLVASIENTDTFKVGVFYILLKNIVGMLDIVWAHYGEGDELSEFMNKMTLG
jgi:hypothetical protein